MTAASYAMFWQRDEGERRVGRVELTGDSLALEATVPLVETERIAFSDIARVELSTGVLRVVSRAGSLLKLGSLDRPGALRELAELLFASIAA